VLPSPAIALRLTAPDYDLGVATTTATGTRTIGRLWQDAVERNPAGTAYLVEEDGWHTVSWAEAGQAVDELAHGLLALGVRRGDAFGILASTRLEWVLFDFALALIGAVTAPIYMNSSAKDAAYVVEHSDAVGVLCEDESNEIGTESARCKPADENIGIEKDLHDTALKTSSSVRKPRASAKGMALWRSCSNVINASCRRSASRTTSLRFRSTLATGTYDPAHEVLLYGRSSVEGEPGDQVLTPLRMADGTGLVVDRGWIPLDQGVPVTGGAAAPTGTVTVAGVLFPPDAVAARQLHRPPPYPTRRSSSPAILSTSAACSSSHGISLKNAERTKIDSGSANVMYGMISPGQVS